VTCAKNLGEALMSLGREKEAEKLFAFALELTPKDVDALFNLGVPDPYNKPRVSAVQMQSKGGGSFFSRWLPKGAGAGCRSRQHIPTSRVGEEQ
jgi:tetratricopeptide (TPR) repeat protein